MDIKPLNCHKVRLLIGCVVFLGLAVTRSKQQDTFYFDPAPINQDVVEGDDVRLPCDVSNRRHIMFEWELDRKKLPNNTRRFQEDSDLRILSADRGLDGGAFRCTATNVTTGISIRSSEAKLNILWTDDTANVQLKTPRTRAEVQLGGELLLKCHCDGNPLPQIEWFVNDIRLFGSDRIRFTKNRVRMQRLSLDDNGIYSCKATSMAGVVSSDSESDFMLNMEHPGTAHLNEDTFTRTALVRAGDTTALHCQFRGAIVTEWHFGERRLINDSSKHMCYPNGTLVVHDIAEEDAGSYRCLGISTDSRTQTFVSTLQLAFLSPLTVQSFQPRPPGPRRPVVVPQGQQFHIQCLKPKGMPPPQLSWEVPKSIYDSTSITIDSSTLTIADTTPDHSGNYTCSVTNMAATHALQIWIIVSEPPSFSQPPLSDRVVEGRTAWFHCRFTGTPFPVTVVTWRKGQFPVGVMNYRYKVNPYNGTLVIANVHLEDEDDFTCVVNTTGHPVLVSENAHLYVEKRLKFTPTPVNTKLELNTDSRLKCRADGRQKPRVRWVVDGASGFPDHVQDQGGILQFHNVQYSDAGSYTCMAYTDDERINVTIKVKVVVMPKFSVRPRNTTAYEGQSAMMHCSAIGNPQPEINWDKNNNKEPIDMMRFRTLSNGSLYVTKVYMEDVGRYGCTAGNSGGLLREEIYLHVASANGGTPGALDDQFNMMKTIIIAVCCAVAYLAIVIGLTVYCSIRLVRAKNMRNKMQAERMQAADTKPENGAIPTENTELMDKKDRDSSIVKSDIDARSHVSGVSSSHHSHTSQSHQSAASMGRWNNGDRLNFPRHQLQTLGMLGKGHYGDVFLAKAHLIRDSEPETLVVVKSLLTRDEHHHFEFRREIEMFTKISHENVVRLLGVCREMEPQFLITEYCDWGDLKQFLWATRKDNGKRNLKLLPLTIAQKVTMCQQVALGMEHLSNNRFIHRDLAARNILLSSSLDLKISNLGLCRDVYATEYFPFHQHLIPLRWMPPESVLEDEFSTKSDVWSYGVYCWEVFTLGDLPMRALTDEEVLKGQKSLEGRLLETSMPPLHQLMVPEEMTDLIRRCTQDNPDDRPTFSEISLTIGDMTVDSDV